MRVIRRLLVANRGEVAVRVLRSAAELGLDTVAVAAAGDEGHLAAAGTGRRLAGSGPAAYLDAEALVRVAVDTGCDAVHPGWGFLSESAGFARACADAGPVFVGPGPEHLELLGDKARARELAVSLGVSVPAATGPGVSLADARAFLAEVGGSVLVKAVSGGGGRGIRLVGSADGLDDAYARCRSEAARATGDDRVYLERAVPRARHVEVQIVGDGDSVAHLGERDCSLQRRHQKLVEITPAPALPEGLRERLLADAVRIADHIGYRNLGTVEFLVSGDEHVFIEANPRLQVEHTITEERYGVDLVAAQLRLAAGATLAELRLPASRPVAVVQARITATGSGTLAGFAPCAGPGVRVDTALRAGDRVGPEYDPLLAKVVVTAPDPASALAKARRALAGFTVAGVPTNLRQLDALLAEDAVPAGRATTRFVDEHLPDEPDGSGGDAGTVTAPIGGTVVEVPVAVDDRVRAGQPLVVIESMKMEHVAGAATAATVARLHVTVGDQVVAGQPLAALTGTGGDAEEHVDAERADPDEIRDDLAEVHRRHVAVLDAARPDAVERRHAKGARTARENVGRLCDEGSFVEYGPLVVAAQRRRRTMDELVERTPADGLVMGFGQVNGGTFARDAAQTFVLAFDETVLAGTMGEMAREKISHGLEVARKARTPVVLLAEGGGGRAGDTDGKVGVTGWSMDVSSYHQLARMSGLVPLVGVTAGHCFAANAGLLSCCDVIIATRGANIGVGGPSMVEAGGLGPFRPEELGPVAEQAGNGVVDLVADDEDQAVDLAKRYLAYFQGPAPEYEVPDQRRARFVVPENRLRAYDVRAAVEVLADADSVLELRAGYGEGMITALARVEGRPLGVVANNPLHVGGAVDSDGADKACRFMRLAEAFGLPLLMLCDTPGMMVGPDAERSAAVRKMGRMFVTGANLTVPVMTIVLRKAYGLGAELMAGGWFKAPRFVVGWPTAELGGMNIEGNVRLAHAKELAAITDPDQRRKLFEERVAEMHAAGRALAVATHYELDDVIDPADSRTWIASALATHRTRPPGADKRVPYVDPW